LSFFSFLWQTPQICFQELVDSFSLTISMMLIGHDEMQLGSLDIEQFFPKFHGEIWMMVGDNRVWNSMKFEDIIHENLSHVDAMNGCWREHK
jgi:hypothetical protein